LIPESEIASQSMKNKSKKSETHLEAES
jgi:hypothetical protein